MKVKVTQDDITKEAAKLLIKSGYSAKSRTEKRADYMKKGIKYAMPLGKALVNYIITEKIDTWREWLKLTEIYLQLNKDSMLRPTIDRVDSNSNYNIDNIDFLPFYEHIQKDKAISTTVIMT